MQKGTYFHIVRLADPLSCGCLRIALKDFFYLTNKEKNAASVFQEGHHTKRTRWKIRCEGTRMTPEHSRTPDLRSTARKRSRIQGASASPA